MIIVSKFNRNSAIKFNGKKIEFDETSQAKVTKEVGESLVTNFPNDYWEEGKRPMPAKKGEKDEVVDNAKVEELENEIIRLKIIIEDKDKAIKVAKEGEQTWRDEFQKLKDKVDGKVENEDNQEDDEFEVPEKHLDLLEGMKTKNFLSLKKWIKDNFAKTEEDLEGISDRDGLIKFVFENCEIDD